MGMLGFGIVSYMQLLQFMVRIFLVLTLLQLPVLYMYYTNGGAPIKTYEIISWSFDKLMLSNMGYSSVSCESAPVSVGVVALQCSYGVVGEIYDFGLNERHDDGTYQVCMNN